MILTTAAKPGNNANIKPKIIARGAWIVPPPLCAYRPPHHGEMYHLALRASRQLSAFSLQLLRSAAA
jgi:hypothetical protein